MSACIISNDHGVRGRGDRCGRRDDTNIKKKNSYFFLLLKNPMNALSAPIARPFVRPSSNTASPPSTSSDPVGFFLYISGNTVRCIYYNNNMCVCAAREFGDTTPVHSRIKHVLARTIDRARNKSLHISSPARRNRRRIIRYT